MSPPEDTRIALFEQPDTQEDSIAAPTLEQFEAGAKAPSPTEDGGVLPMRRHRLSAAFPDLSTEEYAALVESVRLDGLRDAIWTLRGEILDGWHRYRACREVGREPRFREYEGDQPANFVLAQQRARRNWTSSQAAAVAVAIEPDLAAEAERRAQEGRSRGGGDRKSAGYRSRQSADDSDIPESGGFALQIAPPEVQPITHARSTRIIEASSVNMEPEPNGLAPALPDAGLRERPVHPTPQLNAVRDHKREIAGRSDQQAALALGTNRQYVRDYKLIEKADPALARQVHEGNVPIPRALRTIREREAAERRRAEEARNIAAAQHEPTLHCADFRAVELDEGSVDAIITDPPYPREYLPLYGDLAEYAARILKPGGLVLAMAGQSYLPEIYRMMGEHLTYVWTLCYATPGASTAAWQTKARSNWKPVLLYSKGKYARDSYLDYLSSEQAEKEHHEWGQNEESFATLVKRFTKTDDLVLDPFLGGGTTGVAAIIAKRRFVGIERDPVAYERARGRLDGLAASLAAEDRS